MTEPVPAPEVLAALVEEATRKSAVLWLDYDGLDRPRPAWHVWHDGAAYVVTERSENASDDAPAGNAHGGRTQGATEQRLPGLAAARTATVTCRSKETRARIVTWRAEVRALTPETPEWQDALKALRGERLNATDAERLPERWAATATIVRLIPTGEVLEGPGQMPTEPGAAAPPDTPALTSGRLPWVVHKRPRTRPRLS
ncbi:hypothetical protein [Actinopolymorpha alba]|uniref:hypothetical protein n=1 Tax=Actinopolymorpha alba TaxID=533267 RepID=UPI00037E6732|nr:hypothetical protein [Actinopolymorpha alba]